MHNTTLVLAAFFTFWANMPASGQAWQRVQALPADQVTALCVLGDTLFVASASSVHSTFDGGLTWEASTAISPTLDYISSVRYARGRLYVATVLEGVYVSPDGGKTWQPDNSGLSGLGALNLSCLEIRGDSLYAGTYGAGVFVRKLSTQSPWSTYSTGMFWGNVESVTNIGGTLYAGAGGSATVSVQTPPGHAWVERSFAEFNGSLNAFLAVVPHGDALLAAGTLGLYRSTDGGNYWTPYNPGTGVLGSARLVVVGDRVVANLAKPAAVSFLRITTDGGQTWQPFEPNLTDSYGYDLALYDGHLYAARSNGLWRLALTTSTPDVPASAAVDLGQNYPNPFSGRTHIPFSLDRQTEVDLSVVDATGRLVRTLFRGEKTAGPHAISFDAEGLPPGLYHYHLKTPAQSATRTLLITP